MPSTFVVTNSDAPSSIDFSTCDSAAALTITSTSATTSRTSSAVADVAVDEREPLVRHHVGEVLEVPRVRERVERDDLVRRRLEQVADEVRGDEPRAAGDEHALHVHRRNPYRPRRLRRPQPTMASRAQVVARIASEERVRTRTRTASSLRSNAHAAVPIETADGGPAAEPPAASRGRSTERFLQEAHHTPVRPAVGARPLHVRLPASTSGLRPEHRLLDFGCGALRLGVLAIPYLDAGNYFGVDSHLEQPRGGRYVRDPAARASRTKRPRLLWNDDFAFSHFGRPVRLRGRLLQPRCSVEAPRASQRAVRGELADVSRSPGGRLLTATAARQRRVEIGSPSCRPGRSCAIEQDAPSCAATTSPHAATWRGAASGTPWCRV